MEKGILVKDIFPNMEISGIFVVVNPLKCQSRNGPYWRFNLSDKTGSIEAKIWFPKSQEYSELLSGQPALASGRSDLYRDQVQLAVDELHFLDDEEKSAINQRDFLPASLRDPDEMMNELKSLCNEEFRYLPWRKFVMAVLCDNDIEKKLMESPAARGIHHAWIGGLLEHTLGVAKLCMQIANLYPELDRQTLLAGAIFHDLGKIEEFSCIFSIDYTSAGSLQGHGYLALEILMPFFKKSRLKPELVEHLKHMILSHHGVPEYGAAKVPQTMEAFILHFADNIDARMTQCKGIFASEHIEPGGWSSWQKTLERKIFNAPQTPSQDNKINISQRDEICLSLLKE